MGAERAHHIVDCESGGIRIGKHTRRKRAQSAFVLARRMGLGRCCADEGTDAAPVSMTPALRSE
jgi:hypothetical protein